MVCEIFILISVYFLFVYFIFVYNYSETPQDNLQVYGCISLNKFFLIKLLSNSPRLRESQEPEVVSGRGRTITRQTSTVEL